MSYTEIYKFKKSGKAEFLGETKNAWRGAMAIWNILDEKYLPPFIPEWAKNLQKDLDKKYYRSHDFAGKAIKEVWDLFKSESVSETDKIVLGSTFDNVIVLKNDLPKLIEAFRNFKGQTSLKEQADILEKALKEDKNLIAIAWNQTSINSSKWIDTGKYTKTDNPIPYNILKDTEHWNLFESEKIQEKK